MLWGFLSVVAASSNVAVIVVNKKLLKSINEINVTIYYFFFTFLLLTATMPFLIDISDFYSITLKDILLIAITAVLNVFAIYIYMCAVKKGDMSEVVPIRNTTPLFVAVLAAMFLSEDVTLALAISIPMIIVGSIVISFKRGSFSLLQRNRLPMFYAFSVAIIAAVVFIIVKYVVTNLKPFLFIYISSFVSSIMLAFVILVRGSFMEIIRIVKSKFRYFSATGGFCALALVATVYAISLEKASIVAAFLRIELLLSILAGTIFFRERLTRQKVMGGIVIFAGLLLVVLSTGT